MTFTPWFLDDDDWHLPTEIEEDDMTPCAVIGIVVVAGLLWLLWKITEGVRR